MLLQELFSRLGLETDAASFAKGALAAKGVEIALAKLADAARFVTEQLKEATLGVFEQADNLDDLATKTGVSTATLQELGYAGQFADVSMDTLAQSLRILQKNMAGAVDGNKELKDAFRTLKVDLVDSTGKLRSTEDVFTDLSDRFADMPESAAKTSYMMKVFGKSGADIAGVLNLGSDGLREFTEEFRDLGAELDESFIADSAEFEDNVLRLKTGLQGVRNTIAEALLPVFNDLASSTLEWFKANKELVKVKLREWIADAVATVRFWIASIREWIEQQGGLTKVIEKAKEALKVFATFLVVKEVLSFVAALFKVAEVLEFIRVAIAANPIGLLITLLAAAVTLWIQNWDDIREFFEFVWDRITGGLADGAQFIRDEFDALVNWVAEKLSWLGDKAQEAYDFLNPFNIEDDSSSGTRGATTGGSSAEDRAFLLSRGVTPAPVLVERPAGRGSVSLVSSPQINITTHPSQDNEAIGKIAAREVEKHNERMLREAAGGIQ